MEGLMHFCTQWGLHGCHDDISQYNTQKELGLADNLKIWPVGKELKRLDDICKTCKHRLFEIEEPQCPACASKEISKIGSGGQGHRPDLENIFFYKCENCNSKLSSRKEFK